VGVDIGLQALACGKREVALHTGMSDDLSDIFQESTIREVAMMCALTLKMTFAVLALGSLYVVIAFGHNVLTLLAHFE